MESILRSAIRLGAAMPAAAVHAAASALGDRDHGLRELANKVRAYERFVSAPDVEGRDLAGALAGLDDWESTWVREGVGYRRGLRRAGTVERAAPLDVADEWRLPLHTGFGLGLAVEALDALSWRPDRGEVRSAVGRFARRALAGAGEGWRLAVLEALGLVARTLHPHRLGPLDEAVAAAGPELRRAFWHGAGRGLYFAPTAALPFVAGSAAQRLRELAAAAPDGEARDQVVSGWAWALALVNVRHPEVVAAALADGGGAARSPAFADGVACALVVWLACGGAARRVERFLAHRPAVAAAEAAGWRLVIEECETAVARAPAAGTPLGGLFVHRAGRWSREMPWDEGSLHLQRMVED